MLSYIDGIEAPDYIKDAIKYVGRTCLIAASISKLLKSCARTPASGLPTSLKATVLSIAGPGSGKTKTLTTKLARILSEDVQEPRGVALHHVQQWSARANLNSGF